MQILKFEFLKIFKNKSFIGAWVVLLMSIMAIIFIGFFHSQLMSDKHSSISGRSAGERNLEFAEKYKGELTDKKVKTIITDYLDIYQEKVKEKKQIFDYFQWTVVDTFTPVTEQDIYMEMIDSVRAKKTYTIDNVKILSMHDVGYKTKKFPIYIGNFMTWTDLLQVSANAFIPIALFVILFCSILFANDTSKNLVTLLLSTRFGRTKMIRSKIIVGTVLTIGTFLVAQLIILTVFGCFYGFSGRDTSVQANLDWRIVDFPLEWNMLQTYIFGICFHLIGLLFVSGFTMLVSSLCSSPFSALAISLGLFFVPQALKQLLVTGLPNKILYLFPINTFEIDKVLLWMSRDNMFFFHSFIANISLIAMVMLGMKFGSDLLVYLRMKKLSLA